MKQIRVAMTGSDDCFRCERILNDAGIPFKLIVQSDSHLPIDVANEFSRVALMPCIRRALPLILSRTEKGGTNWPCHDRHNPLGIIWPWASSFVSSRRVRYRKAFAIRGGSMSQVRAQVHAGQPHGLLGCAARPCIFALIQPWKQVMTLGMSRRLSHLLAALAVVWLAGCTSVGSLGLITKSSVDPIALVKQGNVKNLGPAEGRACRYFALAVIPWGNSDIQAAVDRALAPSGGDALANVSTATSLHSISVHQHHYIQGMPSSPRVEGIKPNS